VVQKHNLQIARVLSDELRFLLLDLFQKVLLFG